MGNSHQPSGPLSPNDTHPDHIVTAVIVAHDGAGWLPRVTDAVLGQTQPVQRIVAVDTGSRDRSGAVLADLLGSEVVSGMERDTGYGAAVARALRHRAAIAPLPPVRQGSPAGPGGPGDPVGLGTPERSWGDAAEPDDWAGRGGYHPGRAPGEARPHGSGCCTTTASLTPMRSPNCCAAPPRRRARQSSVPRCWTGQTGR